MHDNLNVLVSCDVEKHYVQYNKILPNIVKCTPTCSYLPTSYILCEVEMLKLIYLPACICCHQVQIIISLSCENMWMVTNNVVSYIQCKRRLLPIHRQHREGDYFMPYRTSRFFHMHSNSCNLINHRKKCDTYKMCNWMMWL